MSPRICVLVFLVLIMIPAATSGQTIAQASLAPFARTDATSEALAALGRLRSQVIVYRTQQEFDDAGRLANISLVDFENEFMEVTAELATTLESMPAGRVKTNVMNALASYRDGLHWWRKVDRPRVVHVSMLAVDEDLSPADMALKSTAAYTVAIHWRQAARYLQRAEVLIQSGER